MYRFVHIPNKSFRQQTVVRNSQTTWDATANAFRQKKKTTVLLQVCTEHWNSCIHLKLNIHKGSKSPEAPLCLAYKPMWTHKPLNIPILDPFYLICYMGFFLLQINCETNVKIQSTHMSASPIRVDWFKAQQFRSPILIRVLRLPNLIMI